MYDLLIVGAGLFGATLARLAADAGKRCLVLEKRAHLGGNAATREERGIVFHQHGAHIFHTDNEDVWNFARRFADFLPYTHRVMARSRGRDIPLPIHMGTFRALWGNIAPEEARAIIESQRIPCDNPQTVEELGLSTLGRDVYEALIEGYTRKQWGLPCSRLPASILKRIPLRFDDNDSYFSDPHQGIPRGGYTPMAEEMLRGIDVRRETDYLADPDFWNTQAHLTVYTGAPDALFGFRLGPLAYRTVRFEHEWVDRPDFQGRPVVNYTDGDVPFTRIIEHQHFEPRALPHTLITREYPARWENGMEPYYPMGDEENRSLYERYAAMLPGHMRLGGRLGLYRYLDMDDTIALAMKLASEVLA